MLLLADPIIVLMPSEDSNEQAWQNYYNYLRVCSQIVRIGLHEVVLSELCRLKLFDAARFPKTPLCAALHPRPPGFLPVCHAGFCQRDRAHSRRLLFRLSR